VCLPQPRVRRSGYKTTEKRPFDLVNDEKQKEREVADQFFRSLLEDHSGTQEEREAVVNALNGLRVLRMDAAAWRERQYLK